MRGARPEAALEAIVQRGDAIRQGDRVLVACSGGPDSVALAAALHAVAVPMQLELALGYVHHATRESAWQDECVVLRLGASLGVPVRVAPLAAGSRDEATLRERRYASLIAMAGSLGSTVVATGHHAADQSETVLLALFRGAGPQGLVGMRPRRDLAPGLDLARPFLSLDPGEAMAYCLRAGHPYAVDPGNADAGLRRNAVRAALAALRPLFPGLDKAVARAAVVVGDEIEAPLRADLRKRVRAIVEEQDSLLDLDFLHVEAAVRAIEGGGSGDFHMKPGIALRIEAGSVSVITKDV